MATEEAHPAPDAPFPLPPAAELFDVLRRFVDASEQITTAVAAVTHLHRTDAAAVMEIAGSAAVGLPMSSVQLRSRLRLSPAATTALLDRLERAGHVRRSRDASDRRRVLLDLTPTGGQVVEAILPSLAQAMSAAVADYSDDQHRFVTQYLRHVVAAVEATAQALADSP